MTEARGSSGRAGADFGAGAPVDVVVDQGGEQVLRIRDGVQVPGKAEIDGGSWLDRRETAARGTPLHPKDRTQRRLSKAGDGAVAQSLESHREANGDHRLAFAMLGRGHRTDEDEVASTPSIGQGSDQPNRHFEDAPSGGDHLGGREAEVAGNLRDGPHARRLHGHAEALFPRERPRRRAGAAGVSFRRISRTS